jgi:hypothetical protein
MENGHRQVGTNDTCISLLCGNWKHKNPMPLPKSCSIPGFYVGKAVFIFLGEKKSHSVAQIGLELAIFLPQPFKRWDDRLAPSWLAWL